MTTPFWCLLIAVLLPYAWAGVAGAFKGRDFDDFDLGEPRVQSAQLEGAGRRAVAAQSNAWEALSVFTAAVAVAHLSGADTVASATAAVVFVAARVIHGVGYLAGIPTVRVAGFAVGMGASLRLFQLAAAA